MSWLKDRIKELDMTLEDVQLKLELYGFNYSISTLSNWQTGKHLPPLHDPNFRLALADILKMSVRDVLDVAGYEVDAEFSLEARRAASILDRLDEKKRAFALDLLEKLLEV